MRSVGKPATVAGVATGLILAAFQVQDKLPGILFNCAVIIFAIILGVAVLRVLYLWVADWVLYQRATWPIYDSRTARSFIPKAIITELRSIDLRFLRQSEPKIQLETVIRNFSGYPVHITDVKTYAHFAEPLTQAGSISRPIDLRTDEDSPGVTVTQPMLPDLRDKLKDLLNSRETVRASMRIDWIGFSEHPTGRLPLEYAGATFEIIFKGPVDLGEETGLNLAVSSGSFFYNDKYWDNNLDQKPT